MFELIVPTRPLSRAGLLLAALPLLIAVVAALRKRRPPAWGPALLMLYPLAVLAVQRGAAAAALEPPRAAKVDLRVIRFLEVTADLAFLGPLLAVLAGACLLAPPWRRTAWVFLPGAVWLAAAEFHLRGLLLTVAFSPPDGKVHLAAEALAAAQMWGLGGLAIALVVGGSAHGWTRFAALTPSLPLLAWPGWIPLLVLAEPVGGSASP